jgi:hypothetical protein
MILPASSVRQFSTWFYQLKCNMLAWEIGQSGQHPATWEKKGSALFTTMNVEKYRQVRTAANRILNKIRACGGHVFYVGLEKNRPVAEFKVQALYLTVLGEAMKRLNQYADQNNADMVIVMDEHQDREAILTRASQAMYGGPPPPPHHRASLPSRKRTLPDVPVRRLAVRSGWSRRRLSSTSRRMG